MLAVGAAAQGVNAVGFLGLPVLTPQLRDHFRLDLPAVGLLLGAVSLGTVLALVPWGVATDRFGERPVMLVGLLGSAACLGGAALATDVVVVGAALLGLGLFGASVNAASGRAVMTWFADGRRGLAMGVRQTATPLGAALAAVSLPTLAARSGVPAAFAALGGLTTVVALAVALWVREPPGAVRAPRRRRVARVGGGDQVLRSPRLWRLALGSGLLVVPQFTASALLVEFLHDHHGLSAGSAAVVLGVAQVLGGAGRLGTGLWSDASGSRLGPLRVLSALVAAGFLAGALVDSAPVGLVVATLVPTAALALCWNALAYTAAGEMAPSGRSGTALGLQNSANFASAALTPAAAGWVATHVSWPAALLLAAGSAAAARLVLHGLREGSG
ncbi:Sugar phosphate permease [Streptoalloteichus hindustanus]|uniref:Sugar phosphate permease n=1 Tax=Streptoalloteichus hindustanus TaxID=2017 RepID=A0A1M4U8R8_STRHI|nr:Sugar phosphate permease [Streptoalloteichus hindustanus]